MSGIKETFVSMPTRQRDSMLSQIRQSQNEVARVNERNRQLQEANNNAQTRINALDNKINTQIAGLSNQIREVERRQNAAFRNALERQGADIRSEIREQGVQLRREMQSQRTELTQMINSVVQQINAEKQGQQERALEWVSQVEAFIKEIDNYRHNMFTPNRLQGIRTRLQHAQGSINLGDYQAAISTAQEAFTEAALLRCDVVNAEIEWVRSFERLSNDVAELSAEINATKLLNFEIGDEIINAQIDYWTEGALSRLEERVSEIKQILKEPDNVSNDNLVSLITEIYNLSQNLSTPRTGLIDLAREAIMLSQCRADIISDIAEVFADRGWRLDDYTYRNGEEKEALHGKIVDGTGNEIVVIVEPQMNQGKLENKILLNFFDEDYNTSNTEMRVSSIKQTLKENDLITDLRCVEGYQNKPSDKEELRDIGRIKKPKKEVTQQ